MKAATLGLLVGALCASVQASPYTDAYRYDNYRYRIISQIRLNEATEKLCEKTGNGCYNILDKHKKDLIGLAVEYMQVNGIETERWDRVIVNKTEGGFRISGKIYVGDKAHLYTFEPDYETGYFLGELMILDGEHIITKPLDSLQIHRE